jgi:hypothetical protein
MLLQDTDKEASTFKGIKQVAEGNRKNTKTN